MDPCACLQQIASRPQKELLTDPAWLADAQKRIDTALKTYARMLDAWPFAASDLMLAAPSVLPMSTHECSLALSRAFSASRGALAPQLCPTAANARWVEVGFALWRGTTLAMYNLPQSLVLRCFSLAMSPVF